MQKKNKIQKVLSGVFSYKLKANAYKLSAGFTLIEALVYSALLALFLGASIMFTSNILSAGGRAVERTEILANQEFLEKKLNWLIGQSSGISSPVSGSSASTLTLAGEDSSLYPATIYLDNEKVMLDLPGQTGVPITNNRVKVTTFSVAHIANQDLVPALRVTLSLSSISSNTISSTINFSYVTSQ